MKFPLYTCISNITYHHKINSVSNTAVLLAIVLKSAKELNNETMK